MTTQGTSPESPRTWRTVLVHEAIEYALNFGYLLVFLVAFAWYGRLILAAHHIDAATYWMPVLEAAILAKLIMLGDVLHVGRRLNHKPLALIAVYRAIVFSLFVLLFSLVEHMVKAMLHGKSPAAGVAEIAEAGYDVMLARCVVIFAAFLPFFAMKEIEQVFGADRVRSLFFRWPTEAPSSSATQEIQAAHNPVDSAGDR